MVNGVQSCELDLTVPLWWNRAEEVIYKMRLRKIPRSSAAPEFVP
jgi:hypothetical protein